MTCIIGYKDKDIVYLAGDGALSMGNTNMSSAISKVFYNGDFVLGNCGSCRMGDILEYSFIAPKIEEGGEYNHRFMCTSFIESLKQSHELGGFDPSNDENNGEILVAVRDKLFIIFPDYSVVEYDNHYYAVGCGHDIAKGAIFALEQANQKRAKKDKLSVEFMLTVALNAASHFMGSVSPPFVIANTGDLP